VRRPTEPAAEIADEAGRTQGLVKKALERVARGVCRAGPVHYQASLSASSVHLDGRTFMRAEDLTPRGRSPRMADKIATFRGRASLGHLADTGSLPEIYRRPDALRGGPGHARSGCASPGDEPADPVGRPMGRWREAERCTPLLPPRLCDRSASVTLPFCIYLQGMEFNREMAACSTSRPAR